MKDKIITYSFIIYIFMFAIFHFVFPDKEISYQERRQLAGVPAFELSGEYVKKADKYLLDQFPGRTTFRSIKAYYNYYVLGELLNNNIFLKDNSIYKTDYPTNKKSIDNFIESINSLKANLSEKNKSYVMIIPDKNYYLEDKRFLKIDYDYLYKKVNSIDVTHIDIRNVLNNSDFYETDTHWRQEKLDKVVKHMSKSMNIPYQEINYQIKEYAKFYGVYYGESAINRKPENLKYVTNNMLEEVEVKYLENDNLTSIYNEEKLSGLDAYEVYLDGASSFIEITNKKALTNKELVVFRDSFGSSLSPLLIPYYSKITVIDNRYISSKYFNDLIEFTNQDVLFLYSTMFINNSFTLKKLV